MDAAQLLTVLAERLSTSPEDVDKSLKALSEVLIDLSKEEASVLLPRFGTFAAVKEEEHTERLADGTLLLMPPSLRLRFSASGAMRNNAAKLTHKPESTSNNG